VYSATGEGEVMNESNSTLVNPKGVTTGRGMGWITDGFGFFKSSPLAWVGAIILFVILVIVVQLIPVLGPLLINIFFPVFVGGLMLGCREQDPDGAFKIGHLFAGFTQPCFIRLAILGVFYFIASIILVVLMIIMLFFLLGGTGFIEQIQSGQADQALSDPKPILLASLIGALIAMPILMAEWFAPALVTFQEISPINAMIVSFKGCLVNVMPFFIYGIIGFILFIIATIPLFLGYLILMPVLFCSVYVAYKDIFEHQT
jgi:uncharacterized membrane protein